MDRHILYLLSTWKWYIHIYIYRVRRSILTSWGRHKSKWVTLKPSLTPSPTCRRSRLLSPYEEGLYKKHVGMAWFPWFEQMFLCKVQVCLLHLFVEQWYFSKSLCSCCSLFHSAIEKIYWSSVFVGSKSLTDLSYQSHGQKKTSPEGSCKLLLEQWSTNNNYFALGIMFCV